MKDDDKDHNPDSYSLTTVEEKQYHSRFFFRFVKLNKPKSSKPTNVSIFSSSGGDSSSSFFSTLVCYRFECLYKQTMGCVGSCLSGGSNDEGRRRIRKPTPWAHTEQITREQLIQLREEFWDTAPHYGGQREIWDALRAAAEASRRDAQTIIDSAGVIVAHADLTLCYDERGARYELPKYVLSEPTNLIRQG